LSHEYSNVGLSDEYKDMVNDANYGYRDHVLTKLNLKSPIALYGGGIKVDFGESDNTLPMDKITSLVETHGEEYVAKQLGGFIEWIKGLLLKRKFDKFKTRYDKLCGELDRANTSIKHEADAMQLHTTKYAEHMRELFLNRKKKAMLDIMLIEDKNMPPQRKQHVTDLINLATVADKQKEESLANFMAIISKKAAATKGWLWGDYPSYYAKISESYTKTSKEFSEIYKEFSELQKAGLEAKLLDEQFKNFKPIENPTTFIEKSQQKEYEHWKANRAKYEKINEFTDARMNETLKLVQEQSKYNIIIHDYNEAFGKVEDQKKNATAKLGEWDIKIKAVYAKLTECIKLGGGYAGKLDDAKQKIVNNSNLITSLSLTAVEPVLKEYETHITSVDYTSNLMKKLVATLGEIKNDFINLARPLVFDEGEE
jgi:hypothetical protein